MAQQKQLYNRRNDAFVDGSLALQIEKRREGRRVQAQVRPREVDLYENALRVERTRRLERQRRQEQEREELGRRQRQVAVERAKLEERQQKHVKKRNAAFLALTALFVVAGLVFVILFRNAKVEELIVKQNRLNAQISSAGKEISELEVNLNRRLSISDVQEYAKDTLGMDYPTPENTRYMTSSK